MLTKKHDRGSTISIQGQDVHIPPPGVVWDYFGGSGWIDVPIEDWGEANERKRFWRRASIPEWYKTRRKVERQRQESDRYFVDPQCEQYRIEEWQRRMNGMWFHNGPYGPTYITGLNWFYLQHWYIAAEANAGYPSFYVPDQEIFYLLRFACDDPDTLGLDLLTKRQCFDPNERVRMYDGGIKKVGDVKVGDKLMGPDIRPRNVLTTTSGTDVMYRVTPRYSSSFICNENHILYTAIQPEKTKNHLRVRKKTMTVGEYMSLSREKKETLRLEYVSIRSFKHSFEPFSVEQIGNGEYAGFQVDGNNLFLMHDGLIAHNSGKSAKSGCFLYELISRSPSAHGGIQSKTDEDAKEAVYIKSIYNPFARLPHYFKPAWRAPRRTGDIPSKLVFKSQESVEEEEEFFDEEYEPRELDSFIDYRSRNVHAYDGPTLTGYIGDEIRKTHHIDVKERRRVVRKACTNMDGNFRGKVFETTTVETIEGNTEEMDSYIQMWKESDQNSRDPETNRTESGMIHYFLHSDRARNYDQWGHTDVKRNRKLILMQRPDPKKSLKDYYSEVRKEPLNEGEAFSVVSKDCIFNAQKLNDQLELLTWREDIGFVRGRLRWVGEPAGIHIRTKQKNTSGKVEWIDDPNGDFYLLKDAMLPESELNNIRWTAGVPRSQNHKKIAVGIDTIDHDTVQDGYKSKMAAWAMRRRDITDPESSNTFFLLYWDRPAKAAMAYENIIKMLYWLGVDGLYENNRDKMKMYFEFRGMVSLLWTAPGKKDPGLAASTRTKQDLAEVGIDYVEDFVQNIKFIPLIRDMLKFDLTNTRKSDLTMAALWALMKDMYMMYIKKTDSDAKERKRYARRYKQRAR